MEDDDSCRICRSGPEPNAPLYHPCKCTGSIRYCHQDCLVEWLQHSRKKYCELCNHAFIFHKKYRKDMPSDGKLPSYLYARRLVVRSAQVAKLAARAVLVGFTWLALLPYININVWRFWFWSIDYVILYWFLDVANRLGMDGLVPPYPMDAAPPANVTATAVGSSATVKAAKDLDLDSMVKFSALDAWTRIASPFPSPHTPITMSNIKAALRQAVEKLAHDVFHGQILSCVIVVFFVGVFLLREWILQNMPQNFDAQPNFDRAQQVQPLAEAVAQPQRPEEREQHEAQIRADFEQRRDQLERLLARLPELEAPPQPQEDEGAAEGNHELDLDPETQREQARQARIRRLEQIVAAARRDGDLAPNTEVWIQDNVDSSSETDGDAEIEVHPDRDEPGPSQQSDTPDAATQNLQDVLGWSEAGPTSQNAAPMTWNKTRNVDFEQVEAVDGDQNITNRAHDEASLSRTPIDVPSTGPSRSGDPATHDTTDQSRTEAAHTSAQTDAQANANEPPPDITVEGQDDNDGNDDNDDNDDDDAAWEDVEPDQEDQAALRAAAAALFPPPIAHAVADDEIEIVAAAAAAEDPELEMGLVEEMDGILEAIGMRGPIFGIVQNLFLMIFLSFFVMQAFVMLPYVVGRLLGSGPGLVKVLALPVRLLRYVTDPVFDALIAVGARGWPKIAAAMGMSASPTAAAVQSSTPISGWVQKYLPAVLSQTATTATQVSTQQAPSPVAARPSAVAGMLIRLLPASLTTSSQWKAVSNAFDVALSTGLRGTLERFMDSIFDLFARLDSHRIVTSNTDRAVCIAFGHTYWLLVLFVHQHLSKPDLQRAAAEPSALKSFMDQHVLIIKAISFIFIELFIFPLGCGLLFDICMMPFLAEASVASWPDRVRMAPFSFAFTRWMGGTIYMFVFAQYVGATRKVLRPGVLCWIRDPNDPSFHPIREILDKKTWTQLKKIGASAVMYAIMLVASVGVNTYFLRYAMGWSGVLPLRWKPFDPWMEVPLDLLLVHFAVPWATQRVDPERLAEKWMKKWWRGASRMLRLSSYLIGGEFKHEQQRRVGGNAVVDAWNALVNRKVDRGEGEWVEDGGLCRVPADDKAITSGPLIIPLNADGTPPTERLAEAITKQEQDAEKHTPKPTYTNIYLPSNYRFRITAILTLLWLSHCALFILGLAIPLSIGRAVTHAMTGRQVHDFYSFSIGLTLLVLVAKLYRGARKIWSHRLKRARYVRTSTRMYIVIRVMVEIKRISKGIFVLVGMGGLVPLVVGLLVDQYVVVPLRYRSTQIPVLHLGQIWACGVIEARLLLFIARCLGVPSTGLYARFMSNVDAVVRGGLYPRPKVKVAWKRVVLPTTVAGFTLLSTPFAVAFALSSTGWVDVDTREQEQLLLRKVFGALQSGILVAAVRAVVRKRMDSWTELLKDEVFLESTELKNFESEGETDKNGRGTWKENGKARAVDESEEEALVARGRDAAADEYAAEGPLPDVLFR